MSVLTLTPPKEQQPQLQEQSLEHHHHDHDLSRHVDEESERSDRNDYNRVPLISSISSKDESDQNQVGGIQNEDSAASTSLSLEKMQESNKRLEKLLQTQEQGHAERIVGLHGEIGRLSSLVSEMMLSKASADAAEKARVAFSLALKSGVTESKSELLSKVLIGAEVNVPSPSPEKKETVALINRECQTLSFPSGTIKVMPQPKPKLMVDDFTTMNTAIVLALEIETQTEEFEGAVDPSTFIRSTDDGVKEDKLVEKEIQPEENEEENPEKNIYFLVQKEKKRYATLLQKTQIDRKKSKGDMETLRDEVDILKGVLRMLGVEGTITSFRDLLETNTSHLVSSLTGGSPTGAQLSHSTFPVRTSVQGNGKGLGAGGVGIVTPVTIIKNRELNSTKGAALNTTISAAAAVKKQLKLLPPIPGNVQAKDEKQNDFGDSDEEFEAYGDATIKELQNGGRRYAGGVSESKEGRTDLTQAAKDQAKRNLELNHNEEEFDNRLETQELEEQEGRVTTAMSSGIAGISGSHPPSYVPPPTTNPRKQRFKVASSSFPADGNTTFPTPPTGLPLPKEHFVNLSGSSLSPKLTKRHPYHEKSNIPHYPHNLQVDDTQVFEDDDDEEILSSNGAHYKSTELLAGRKKSFSKSTASITSSSKGELFLPPLKEGATSPGLASPTTSSKKDYAGRLWKTKLLREKVMKGLESKF